MKIGIDVDGVLTDVGSFLFETGCKYFWEKYNKTIVNPEAYDLTDMFGCTQDEEENIWDDVMCSYIIERPRNQASKVINDLRKAGHKIYIITARMGCKTIPLEEMKKVVEIWLEKNEIGYDEIIFSGADKVSIVKKNKINLMIEDSPRQMKNISQIIPVVCFDAIYNREVSGENITRCYSWYDIYRHILSLKRKR